MGPLTLADERSFCRERITTSKNDEADLNFGVVTGDKG